METTLGNTGTPPATNAPDPASGGAGTPPATAATGGGENKSWRDSLPEEIRANPAISSFQDVPSLVKSFIHAQSVVGKKGVIVPGEKATDEDWTNFYQQIGVPSADKYEVKMPDNYKLPDPVRDQFKEVALKNGLLPKQASQIVDWYAKFETAQLAEAGKQKEKAAQEQMEGLKKEWGESYDNQLQGAKIAVKELGGDDFIKYLNETGLRNDTTLIKIFAKASKLLGEDKLREGGLNSDRQTLQQVQDSLAELRANGDSNGLYNKNHPMHAVTLAKMESLAKQLTGGR